MQKVTKELAELKEQIIATPEVDETAEPVTELLHDIDLVLGNPGEFPFAQSKFITKLEDALLHFEVTHKNLVAKVQVVIDSLNEVGI